jgi:hypothetical protein
MLVVVTGIFNLVLKEFKINNIVINYEKTKW